MAELQIKDTCQCGSVFEVQGHEIYVRYQHKDWLAPTPNKDK